MKVKKLLNVVAGGTEILFCTEDGDHIARLTLDYRLRLIDRYQVFVEYHGRKLCYFDFLDMKVFKIKPCDLGISVFVFFFEE